MARPRKKNVKRSPGGQSLGEIGYHPEALANRERALTAAGAPLTITKRELTPRGWQTVTKPTATDQLAGYTLGVLSLRAADGITQEQREAGDRWAGIVRAHAAVMGYRLSVESPNFIAVPKSESVEAGSEWALRVRERYRECYDALTGVARVHGYAVIRDTYGVCVENWPIGAFSLGKLRLGLDALIKTG